MVVINYKVFRQGQRRGEINQHDDCQQLAELFVAMQTLTITNWLTGWWNQTNELEPRLQSAVAIMLNGCLTRTG